jgi:DNA uptake protein ComE-like DNA-binding protein
LFNLNTANEHRLTQLPRIGADKARRIAHHRTVRSGFLDWADLAETPGITDAAVAVICTRVGSADGKNERDRDVTARRRSDPGRL